MHWILYCPWGIHNVSQWRTERVSFDSYSSLEPQYSLKPGATSTTPTSVRCDSSSTIFLRWSTLSLVCEPKIYFCYDALNVTKARYSLYPIAKITHAPLKPFPVISIIGFILGVELSFAYFACIVKRSSWSLSKSSGWCSHLGCEVSYLYFWVDCKELEDLVGRFLPLILF